MTCPTPSPIARAFHAFFALVVAVATAVATAACSAAPPDDGVAAEAATAAERLPQVTIPQAGEAVSDAMLIASFALYRALASGRAGVRQIASEDGRLNMSWSDDADFASGRGRYTIIVDDYSIPLDDPFAGYAYGYALSGSIVLESATGDDSTLAFDLEARHDDPERFPVERLAMNLDGSVDSDTVVVNGVRFSLADLTSIFED